VVENREVIIVNVVELQQCAELEDLIHMATKVERRIKMKGNVCLTYNLGSLSSLKLNFKRERVVQPKPFTRTKVEPPNTKVDSFTASKGKSNT